MSTGQPSPEELAPLTAQEELEEEERRTSYLELFFDLVFVFAITQVTSLVLSDTSPAGFARSFLAVSMVWWAWSGFAWMTNAIDIEDHLTQLAMLLGAAAAFMMAFAIPSAFRGDGAWFGAAYFGVAAINMALYLRGTRGDAEVLRSVLRLAPFFLAGPALVLVGGVLHGGWRDALWSLAIAVNLLGALDAGGRTWSVSASHFAERHALIVIIALGESIVAIGVGAVDGHRGLDLAGSMLLAFAGSAVLWWAYFGYVAGAVERALQRLHDRAERGRLARNVFTFAHFPVIVGIVLFAVAAKKTVAHPVDPLSGPGRFALAAGLALVVLGLAAGRFAVTRSIAWVRLGSAAAIGLAVGLMDGPPAWSVLAVAVAILAVAVARENRRLTVRPPG